MIDTFTANREKSETEKAERLNYGVYKFLTFP